MSPTAADFSSPCSASMSICDLERTLLTGRDMPSRLRNSSTGTRKTGGTVADYTHMNLSEVKDSAPGFGADEFQEARFAREDLDAEQTGISHINVKPGKRMPFGHKHDEAEEIYVVIAGSGRVKLDDEIVEVTELDAIR